VRVSAVRIRPGIVSAILATVLPTAALAATWQNPEAICSDTHTLFCSQFEEGSLSIWDDYDGNPAPGNAIVQDPGPLGYAQNHVNRLRVATGSGGDTDLVKVFTPTNRVYMRWYQQWEPGYNWAARNHGTGLHGGDRNLLGHSGDRPTGSDFFDSWIEPNDGKLTLYTYYRGMYQDCADPAGSCWGDRFPCFADTGQAYCTRAKDRPRIMPPVLNTGQWYCIEIMLDPGTPVSSDALADGQLDFWIDGIEYGPWTNLWFRTTSTLKTDVMWLNLYHHDGTHSAAGVLQDNVVLSTQRIGCLDGPPPGNNPATPANLRRTDVRP
jgi:hypothetical protein